MGKKGPYLNAAVLCEQVLEEKSGVRSLIRIVDRITNTATGAEPPSEMPRFTAQLTAVIILKPGETRGRYAIKLRPEDPSGQQLDPAEIPVHFEGTENRGVSLALPINIEIELEGVYWLDVLFADSRAGTEELLTRIPLQIVYQPQRMGRAPG